MLSDEAHVHPMEGGGGREAAGVSACPVSHLDKKVEFKYLIEIKRVNSISVFVKKKYFLS